MSHPFGDQLSQYLHRKHGLSQSKLAAGILQAPAIITDMCKGKRLTGRQARERVLVIVEWLWQQGVLDQVAEVNALLTAAGMATLQANVDIEQTLMAKLSPTPESVHPRSAARLRRTPPGPRTQPHHLPAQLTTLIGRVQDLALIQKRLLHEGCRLLTLIGPPGVGKTRLAVQAATELADHFVDGVFFVQLATLRDAMLVPAIISQTLGLQESSLPPLDHLKLYLSDKRTLLVLDNLEQILETAPALVELLTACPQLYLLTTSRAPLRVRAERQFPVSPLALPTLDRLPDSETLRHYAAIALFLERSQAVQPDFDLTAVNAAAVATLCARLDGLPLAIELVAARVKLLSPAALLARLDNTLLLSSDSLRDSTPRQQTLRQAIRWSYDLLTSAEQGLFARLGIFSGGFTLEAAEVICGDVLPAPGAILTGLASLVDKSLLQSIITETEPRFGMLETIHEYALEQLALSGTLLAVQRHHAEFYWQLAKMADPHLRSGEQIVWLKRLDAERANLRAALAWCVSEEGDSLLGLRLANALGYYWYLRALYGEGSRWLDNVLVRVGEQAPASLRAWALYNNCLQAVGLDAIMRGLALGEAAQKLAHSLNDQRLLATLTLPLSQHIFCQSGRAQCNVILSEGMQLARTLDDPWLVNEFFMRLISCEDVPAQQFTLRIEALAQARRIGDRSIIICLLNSLASMAIQRGAYGEATNWCEEALLLARQLDDKRNMDNTLLHYGNLACAQGQMEQAAAYYQESLLIAQQTGTPGQIASAHERFGRFAQQQGKPTEALRHYQAGLRIVQPFGHRLFMAPCLLLMTTLASMPTAPLDSGQAARLMGAATAILPLEHMLIEPIDLPDIQHSIAHIRTHLDEPTVAAAWAEGQAMTLDEAIAYALALDIILPNREILC